MSVLVNHEADIEAGIQTLGKEVFSDVQNASVSLFNPEFYTGKLINWAMEDDEFRVSLFRFVDVLPSLRSSAEIIGHVQEYFKPVAHRIPGLMKWGLNLDPNSLPAKAAGALVKSQIGGMAERFILGETPAKALKPLRRIRKDRLAFTVDLLGEATVSEKESEIYLKRYLELIDVLCREVPKWSESKPLVEGHSGEATPVNVSVKLSALYSQSKAVSFEDTVQKLSERLGEILEQAMLNGAFINVDMEDTKLTSITIEVMKRILVDPRFKAYDRIGMVFQTYLRRTEEDLQDMMAFLKTHDRPLTIRLVKGAYWDTETIHAKAAEWPIPVWQEKAASDAAYERCARILIDHAQWVTPAFGSHNIRSLCYAIKYAESKGLTQNDYEIQALFGMAEPIKAAFSNRGYLVRDYAPIGELIPGMGYLVRRLLENTSNKGFIRQGFHEDEKVEVLLAPPTVKREDTGREYLQYDRRQAFRNSALWDFSLASNREAVQRALDQWITTVSHRRIEVYPIVNGERQKGIEVVPMHTPENRNQRLTEVHYASVDHVDQAIARAAMAFPSWRDRSVEERAEFLFKTADRLEEQRAQFTAAVILETGKPWLDADADIAEAIDFLNYYGKHAIELMQVHPQTDFDGEENLLFYEGRGVAGIIGPWNFPVAIPCGMMTAALVSGNCAVLKPAEQSSWTAFLFFQALLDSGIPQDVVSFLPGQGETLGKRMVEHPDVATIAFTGSKAVGLDIVRRAAVVSPGQRHIKKVIAEMGGKNAIVVDADADLDQAVKGILQSAYGFAGQKCSACSRLIVVRPAYERLMDRLVDGMKSLQVGPATHAKHGVGPVIDEIAWKRQLDVIAKATERVGFTFEAPLSEIADTGFFVPPTIFAEVPEGDLLFREEFFGPILAVMVVDSFDDAMEKAMDTEYALTGAVFSRSPSHLRQAAREFRVGNLYLNRGCTGAQVNRQPFGGAAMSGIGSKAGGPDYLHQFVIPRALSENTMRQGFAPMEEE